MAKNLWFSTEGPSWASEIEPVEDGWLIKLTNESSFPSSFFVQRLNASAPKGTPGKSLNPRLILLSENTANPGDSIHFKLSATPEELEVLRGKLFRIRYGSGMGEGSSYVEFLMP